MQSLGRRLAASAALALCLGAAGVSAEEALPTGFAGLAPVGETALGEIQGEGVDPVNIAVLDGVLANNTIGDNVRSGSIDIGGNAFQHFSGVGNIVANSGNAALINSNMSVIFVMQ